MRTQSALLALLCACAFASPAQAADESSPLDLVQRAYDRTLRAPGVRSLELAIYRGGRLVSRRAFDVAYRPESGASQSLLRFTAPSYLRGDALLLVETPSGASDVWLYQSEERRPRRVGAAHRADAFYGSDLSYEELEHQRFAAWSLRLLPSDDPAAALVEAIPPADSQYGRLRIWIDRARTAIARIDFFRGAESQPAKRLSVSLDGVVEEAGYLRVERMRIEQVGRDAWTDVATARMEIDPAISPALFSAALLERESDDLYALAARAGAVP